MSQSGCPLDLFVVSAIFKLKEAKTLQQFIFFLNVIKTNDLYRKRYELNFHRIMPLLLNVLESFATPLQFIQLKIATKNMKLVDMCRFVYLEDNSSSLFSWNVDPFELGTMCHRNSTSAAFEI